MRGVQVTAAFDLEVLPVRADRLDEIRQEIGCTDREAFWSATVLEIGAAQTREAWCAKHGGHRVSTCAICRRLGR